MTGVRETHEFISEATASVVATEADYLKGTTTANSNGNSSGGGGGGGRKDHVLETKWLKASSFHVIGIRGFRRRRGRADQT